MMTTIGGPGGADDGGVDPGFVEEACTVMHNAYEKAALGIGWMTNPESRRLWTDVPEANKQTMRAAVTALIAWTGKRIPETRGGVRPAADTDAGLPTDLDLAEFAICQTCGARITRSASEWFHVDPSEWDRMLCWRNGPRAVPKAVDTGAELDSDTLPVPVITCPACGASIRARMADTDGAQT